MTLIVGPITDIDSPIKGVIQALQPALELHHILVSQVAPPDSDGPVWRWTLSDDAPPIQDPAITRFKGTVERGHFRLTHPQAAAEIRHGLVLETEHGLVVVGVHEGEDDDITELAEQAMAHVAALHGAE